MAEQPELRLAIAMNGGVSLAVWIGGVAMELQRFIESDGRWDAMRKARGIEQARIDVLAGTSAGGLNAVFLALAQAYQDVDLGRLRSMWLDLADFEGRLLRTPSSKDPPSLLDGQYFHDELHGAIDRLISGKTRGKLPVDLLTTATALHGEIDDVRDDFGDAIPGDRYQVLFHFSSRDRVEGDFVEVPDSSAPPVPRASRLVEQLALASRSSSSFPFAFEPWYCDPEDGELFGPGEKRRVDIPNARYLVDGGVLNNLPVDRAINAIFELPASGPVRRIMAAVVPLHDPPSADDPRRKRDERDRRPLVVQVLSSSLLGIPRDENDSAVLRSVAENNEAVAANRAARRDLYQRPYSELIAATEAMWPSYRARAATQSAMTVVDTCIEYLSASNKMDRAPSVGALRAAVRADAPASDYEGWPWIPHDFGITHNWSPPAIRRGGAIVLDLYGMAVAAGCAPARLERAKNDVHTAIWRATVAYGARASADFAVDLGARLAADPAPNLRDAVVAALAPRRSAEKRAALDSAWNLLGGAVETIFGEWSALPGDGVPIALREAMTGPESERDARGREFIARLEAIQSAFAGMASPSEQCVELAIVSPSQGAPVDPLQRTSPKLKLSGDDLAHFGAFLKRSWRANDWLWGRLDGASALGKMLGFTDDEIAERQREIVKDEAVFLCDAIVRDHARGARCLRGRELFKGDPASSDNVPTVARWNTRAGDDWDSWAGTFLRSASADEFVEHLRIGEETVATEVTSPLGVRVSTQALATSTKVLAKSGLPGRIQPVLNGILKPLGGVAAMAYRYTRDSNVFMRQLLLGAATAGAGVLGIADMLNIFSVGALAPFLWLVVLGGSLAGFLRAPLTSLVLGGVVAVTGLLYSVREDNAYIDPKVWRYRPDWIGNRFVALGIIGCALYLIGSRQLGRLDDLWFAGRSNANVSVEFLRTYFHRAEGATGSTAARVCAVVAIVGMPIVKWVQLDHFHGDDTTRQIILIVALGVMLAVVGFLQGRTVGEWRMMLVGAFVGGPFAAPDAGRALRLLLGALALCLAVAGYGAAQHWAPGRDLVERPWQQAALTVAALLPLAGLGWWEHTRARAARTAGNPPPPHILMWTAAPGLLVWVGLVAWPLARHWSMLQGTATTQKQFLTIALGEEVLFRGLLLALLVAAGWDFFSFLLASVAFGLWHVPDAITHIGSSTRVVSALATFVAMFLVSQFVFVPLRLRARNVLAPAFVHAAWNISLTSFWSHASRL